MIFKKLTEELLVEETITVDSKNVKKVQFIDEPPEDGGGDGPGGDPPPPSDDEIVNVEV